MNSKPAMAQETDLNLTSQQTALKCEERRWGVCLWAFMQLCCGASVCSTKPPWFHSSRELIESGPDNLLNLITFLMSKITLLCQGYLVPLMTWLTVSMWAAQCLQVGTTTFLLGYLQ